jgi:hypothetical protein
VTKQGCARPGEPGGSETEQVRTVLVSGARRPPHKLADDGDRLGGIGDRARRGGGGCVQERGELWEANLRRKGRGGRIGRWGGRAGTWVVGSTGNWIGWGWGGRREARQDGLMDAER